MHGRSRNQPAVSEDERQERLKKIGKYCKVSETLLSMRHGNVLTAEAFALTQKILEINPEFYTLWNYRRDIALHLLAAAPAVATEADTASASATLTASSTDATFTRPSLGESEKRLTQLALEKNPKSYCAWHHRRWAAELGCLDMAEELATCNKFLDLDSRNFHCWDYRRFVVAASGVTAADEFAYTTAKINQNFSNFSAWHYRTKLVPRVCTTTEQLLAALDADLQLIQQAYYTEPDDQSAWLYHRWLLLTARQNMAPAQYVLTLTQQLASCDELLSAEPDCKQALLAAALLLQQLVELDARNHGDAAHRRIVEIFGRLRELDPVRVNYYNDVQARQQQ